MAKERGLFMRKEKFSENFLLFLMNGFWVCMMGCSSKPVVSTTSREDFVSPDLVQAYAVSDLKTESEKTQESKIASKSQAKNKKNKTKALKPTAVLVKEPQRAVPVFQIPNRRPLVDPLWVGERIVMDVRWLGTKAGEFILEILPFKELGGRKVYDFKGTARTLSIFAMIYSAEDWVQTFVDYEGLFPYKFVLHGDETRYIRNHLELFDHVNQQQYVHIHDFKVQTGEVSEKKETKALTRFSQDALSALYYIRTFPFKLGGIIEFPMTTGGKQWQTAIRIIAREEVKTGAGYFWAYKTKVETRFQGVLQQKGDSFIWFSDDERRMVLKFEAKVKIGWITGLTREIQLGKSPQ